MNNPNFTKTLYIIAGCNGAGKTTASYTILPDVLNCKEYINADEIARGISPFNPSTVSVMAGKVMLKRINELIHQDVTFSIETTLASKVFAKTIKTAKSKGYLAVLLFFWLQDVEIAKKRVEQRVKSGGHNIEPTVIERRYKSGIKNLFELYEPIVDIMCLYENTTIFQLIAQKQCLNEQLIVENEEIYNALEDYYEKIR